MLNELRIILENFVSDTVDLLHITVTYIGLLLIKFWEVIKQLWTPLNVLFIVWCIVIALVLLR
jgi:hypothetical protein